MREQQMSGQGTPGESPIGDERDPAGVEGLEGVEDIRDELPEDLNAVGFVGPYQFPDNNRRRIPGSIYLGLAAACIAVWAVTRGGEPVLANGGFLLAGVLLGVFGVYCLTSGWSMQLDEKDALVVATGAVGFPVGHASAQLAWRGLRSRPTWRILCYSAEEPPKQRGFVLVDAVDGGVVSQFTEENPEDWSELQD
jgi:hypothetical protein